MTDVGDDAPTFTASLVTDEIEPFDLSDRLGDEPVVLAFFPAAFSNTCTDEMEALRDGFDRDDCALFGVSTDLPHALAAYRAQYDLPFALVGDPDRLRERRLGVLREGVSNRYDDQRHCRSDAPTRVNTSSWLAVVTGCRPSVVVDPSGRGRVARAGRVAPRPRR